MKYVECRSGLLEVAKDESLRLPSFIKERNYRTFEQYIVTTNCIEEIACK